ncbi:MAG TPA: nucleotidyltransferase domain-containing protein [Sediminispirochaeta sp.]|nr:nucleotidyltransferase domain-containing protein [Sediminispirochaeta sp.]
MDSQLLSAFTDTILRRFPESQALYLFGSAATGQTREGSDLDVAVLLPPARASQADLELYRQLRPELEEIRRRPVDLINLRRVSVVFKKEIITTGVRFYTGDADATDEFEMLSISYYQKLNDERREILQEVFRTKRSYVL